MSLKTGQALVSPEGRRFKVQSIGGCDNQSRPVVGLQRLDRRGREQKVIWRTAVEVDGWAGAVLGALREGNMSDEPFLGVLPSSKADAIKRGERVEITAEEASAFRAQMNLRHERERDQLMREVRAWRERFPGLYYRSMDDCIDRLDLP